MKAKCRKSDPLGNIQIGRTYECTEFGRNIIVGGTGMAVSKEQFNLMFEKV